MCLTDYWRKSRLTVDRQSYVDQCIVVKNLISKAKNEFYSNVISENKSNQRVLFSTFQKWTNMNYDQNFPSSSSPDNLANLFADFFEDKILKIQATFGNTVESTTMVLNTVSIKNRLSTFREVSCSDLSKLISPLASKSCDLDPVPGRILKSCFDILLPTINKIVNFSLSSGKFPTNLKKAIIKPVLKKQGMSTEEFSSFRPISNLKFIAKAIERVVANQLIDHLERNSLHETFQSAYKKHHSVKTALLRVHNDILRAIDEKRSVFLILLDLSAAFDTVNHSILLDRMFSRFGIKEQALEWFKSYLNGRSFRVCVEGGTSTNRSFQCGVPQGSILGPILFLIYTSPIGDILRKHGIDFHLYADDTQLYITFETSSLQEMEQAKRKVEACVYDIDNWMTTNKLKLNTDKTEVLLLSAAHRPRPSFESLRCGSLDISPKSTVRNIGVIFDEKVSLENQITSLCKSCFFHIKNIWKIRKFISYEACETLVHAFISSRLDFCNSILYGLPKYQIQKLQRVQNAAGRLVSGSHKYEHITPVLKRLHWLPVEQRIQYKILLLTFKALHGSSPSYIRDLVEQYSPPRSLRTKELHLLTRGTFRLITYGKRAFSNAAPELWNSIPLDIRQCQDITSFKQKLKTFLFKKGFQES